MKNSHHLNPMNLGLALGIIWGLSLLLLGLYAWQLNWGTDMVIVLGSFYIGYAPSLLGSIIGMIWGFVDCFIGGFLLAWVYNWLQNHSR